MSSQFTDGLVLQIKAIEGKNQFGSTVNKREGKKGTNYYGTLGPLICSFGEEIIC